LTEEHAVSNEFETHVTKRLDEILRLVLDLKLNYRKDGAHIMADLSALIAEVNQITTVAASAEALIQGLAAQITSAGTDPVKLAALTSQLGTVAAALGAAVAANTPASPAPAAVVPAPAPVAPVVPAPVAGVEDPEHS
jgi:hypothetical protein